METREEEVEKDEYRDERRQKERKKSSMGEETDAMK